MSARKFESFLTRIYVDAGARARFKQNPRAEAQRAGLSEAECTALEKADFVGLEMAARSFAYKRRMKQQRTFIDSLKLLLRRFVAGCASLRRF